MTRHAFLSLVAVCALATGLQAQDDAPKGAAKSKLAETLKTPRDKASYGIGRNIGDQLKKIGLDLDAKIVLEAIAEALSGAPSGLTPEDLEQALTTLDKEAKEANAAKTKAFLDANGKAEGVKTTKSGLQYQVLKEGAGKRPTADDTVKAHYLGTLLDGKKFDSSYDRGEPAEFPLRGVIKGWTEGVPLMQVGAKYKFWIPSDLAYGPRGQGPIPPNSLLVFEIELIDVIRADGDKPAVPK